VSCRVVLLSIGIGERTSNRKVVTYLFQRARYSFGEFCSARLQAGTGDASKCPPEGGLYTAGLVLPSKLRVRIPHM